MTEATSIDPTIAKLLLLGPAAPIRESDVVPELRTQVRRLLQGDAALFAAAWREHADALRAFAAVHKIKPAGSYTRFYGERLAAFEQARTATLRRAADAESALTARAVAAHESSHGVIWLRFGIPLARISLIAGGGLAQTVEPADETPAEVFARVEPDPVAVAISEEWSLTCYAVGVLAGLKGYQRVTGDPHRGRDTARRDLLTVDLLIGKAIGQAPWSQPVQEFRALLETYTAHHVERNWPWIDVVTTALLEQRTLTGEQVLALRPKKGSPS